MIITTQIYFFLCIRYNLSMQINFSLRENWIRNGIATLVVVFFLCAAYIIFLHPISGIIGAILSLLVGTFIPTVVNLIISFFLAFKLFKISKDYSLILMLCISIILGINFRIIPLLEGDFNYDKYKVVYPNGDEGCGCMYFVIPHQNRKIFQETTLPDFLFYSFISLRDDNIWTVALIAEIIICSALWNAI
jgi:hypothetical protein